MKEEITSLCSPRSGNPVPNQIIIRKGVDEYFKSYSTIVAKRDLVTFEIVLDSNPNDYTPTTMRYLNVFLGYDLKKSDVMNILNGKKPKYPEIKTANLN